MLFVFCRAIIAHKTYCRFFQPALFFCVMHIRRTHTNNSSTGERYHTYRLVASQRVAGKPRQMTLLNLGRHFAVDQDLWASLCVRIEQLLSHQTELLPTELPLTLKPVKNGAAALTTVISFIACQPNPKRSGSYSSGMNYYLPRCIENYDNTVINSFSPETHVNGSSVFFGWPWIMIVKNV